MYFILMLCNFSRALHRVVEDSKLEASKRRGWSVWEERGMNYGVGGARRSRDYVTGGEAEKWVAGRRGGGGGGGEKVGG